MNQFELPSDEIRVNDKCIIIQALRYPNMVGLECEVVRILAPPVRSVIPGGSIEVSPVALYEIVGPHLPLTPLLRKGMRYSSWLCPKRSLMKVPPKAVDGDIDVMEDLGGIVVPSHLAKTFLEWLNDQRETEKAK